MCPSSWTHSAAGAAKSVAMERIGSIVQYRDDYWGGMHDIRLHATYLCPREECLMASIGMFRFHVDRHRSPHGEPILVPHGQPQPMDGLPDEIQRDHREAWSCFYGGDYRASVIMARAAVQRAVRALNGTGSNLASEIQDLAARNIITDFLRSWADEVRFSGNDAAHPEDLGEVTRDDAAESLRFMEARRSARNAAAT
jgi:Domain of unknown function (DUF4145)